MQIHKETELCESEERRKKVYNYAVVCCVVVTRGSHDCRRLKQRTRR